MRAIPTIAVLCVVSFTVCPGRVAAQVAPDLVVLSAQPAVYNVAAYGDFELRYPAQAVININALCQQVGAVDGALTPTQAAEAWRLIAANADKYLAPGDREKVAHLVDRPFSGGTAFAVRASCSATHTSSTTPTPRR